MSIQIKEVAFVFHPVTDIARARKFYQDLLGLKMLVQVEFAPGQWWIEYDIAGQARRLQASRWRSRISTRRWPRSAPPTFLWRSK